MFQICVLRIYGRVVFAAVNRCLLRLFKSFQNGTDASRVPTQTAMTAYMPLFDSSALYYLSALGHGSMPPTPVGRKGLAEHDEPRVFVSGRSFHPSMVQFLADRGQSKVVAYQPQSGTALENPAPAKAGSTSATIAKPAQPSPANADHAVVTKEPAEPYVPKFDSATIRYFSSFAAADTPAVGPASEPPAVTPVADEYDEPATQFQGRVWHSSMVQFLRNKARNMSACTAEAARVGKAADSSALATKHHEDITRVPSASGVDDLVGVYSQMQLGVAM